MVREERTMARRDVEPRWSEPGLLVLASLANGPRHGYAIAREVQDSSGVRLGPGTLYGAIARLEQRGLIESLPAQDRRRPYRLTEPGKQVLGEQLQTMSRFIDAALDRSAVHEAPRLRPSGGLA